jgi:hypothetical protein
MMWLLETSNRLPRWNSTASPGKFRVRDRAYRLHEFTYFKDLSRAIEQLDEEALKLGVTPLTAHRRPTALVPVADHILHRGDQCVLAAAACAHGPDFSA